MFFTTNRAYAEKFGSRWVILSAKYGFIRPDFQIPGPYNVSLNETLRWTRSTLAPFALVRLFSLVPHLLPVVPIILVVTICARAFPVACL